MPDLTDSELTALYTTQHPTTTPTALAAPVLFARNAAQRQCLTLSKMQLDLLIRLPEHQTSDRLSHAFQLLNRSITSLSNPLISHTGMREEFLRQIFAYGSQALNCIERVLASRHGQTRGIDMKWLTTTRQSAEVMGPKQSSSQKGKRHIRRELVRSQIFLALRLHMSDPERLTKGRQVIELASGEAAVCEAGQGAFRLPELRDKDEVWREEMWFWCGWAVVVMGQCLGYRYFRWPVEVGGQVVPRTGEEGEEVLGEWRFRYVWGEQGEGGLEVLKGEGEA